MTKITFYSTSPIDEQRFTTLFQGTDFTCEFASGSIDQQHSNSDASVISIFASDEITADVLDLFPNLQLIATMTTGFDHIDLEATAKRGITVTNVPRYGENTVAEYTFSLLLSLSRKLRQTEAAFGNSAVDKTTLCGFDLRDKTIGLIGTGRIGLHTAAIAKGFGMHIIATDPHLDSPASRELGVKYVPIEELAAQSDVISLHAPAKPENHHLVDSAFLARVKSSAVLVNTARGELVDTTALLEHLQQGKIAGAALDVLEYEAEFHDNDAVNQNHLHIVKELQALPQVILTPHNAFNTHEAVDRIRQTTVQNIIDFYKGSTPNKVEG